MFALYAAQKMVCACTKSFTQINNVFFFCPLGRHKIRTFVQLFDFPDKGICFFSLELSMES